MEKKNRLVQGTKNFMICGVTGWCMEVVFTSLGSISIKDWRWMGKTSLLMFPIYGMGAFLGPVGALTDRLAVTPGERRRQSERLLRHGLLYMTLIFTAEYMTGAWLKVRGMCPWDYSKRPLNIDGLIRLDFAPLWFFAGLLFEWITKKKTR